MCMCVCVRHIPAKTWIWKSRPALKSRGQVFLVWVPIHPLSLHSCNVLLVSDQLSYLCLHPFWSSGILHGCHHITFPPCVPENQALGFAPQYLPAEPAPQPDKSMLAVVMALIYLRGQIFR